MHQFKNITIVSTGIYYVLYNEHFHYCSNDMDSIWTLNENGCHETIKMLNMSRGSVTKKGVGLWRPRTKHNK